MRPKEVARSIYVFLLINKCDKCDLGYVVVVQQAGDDRRGTKGVLEGQDSPCRNDLCKGSEEKNCREIFKNVN